MAQDFLSQEEVDALLKGVTGESDEQEASDENTDGIRPYNLATQERIVRGRMPTMELINERFSRNLRLGLFNFIRRSPEVSVGGVGRSGRPGCGTIVGRLWFERRRRNTVHIW